MFRRMVATWVFLGVSLFGFAGSPQEQSAPIDVFEDQDQLEPAEVVVDGGAAGESTGDLVLGGEATEKEWKPPRCASSRTTADRKDDSSGHQIRVMYVLPSDRKDEKLDTNGKICRSVRAFGTWLARQTGGPSLRFDTFDGELDVGFVRLDKTDAQMKGEKGARGIDGGIDFLRSRIERELSGQLASNKLYAVYYGGGTEWKCGTGAEPPRLPGRVAGVYLKGNPGDQRRCDASPWGGRKPNYIDYLMLHEIVHTLGFVQPSAPHYDKAHVAADSPKARRDLMYGESSPPWLSNHPGGLILDVGHDDYYGHGRAGERDLARSAFLQPTPPNAILPPGL